MNVQTDEGCDVGHGHLRRELPPQAGCPGVQAQCLLKDGHAIYLFAGSNRGAERAVALYSLIETAKLNGIDPEAYLRDVLARVADHPATRLAELLPWTWATALHTAQAA